MSHATSLRGRAGRWIPGPAAGARHHLEPAAWCAALLAAVVFEGFGRKVLGPGAGAPLYFAKDAVLLAAALRFGVGREVGALVRALYAPFAAALAGLVAWAFAHAFTPGHPSPLIAVLGLRAYALWWIAPPVVAHLLVRPEARRPFLRALAVTALAVTALSLAQFALPGDAWLNSYAWNPEDWVAGVAETGRVRVTGSFSYITGLTSFVTLAAPLLLAAGTAAARPGDRWLLFAAAGATFVAAPLTGSRSAIALPAAGCLAVWWGAGGLRRRTGRRVLAISLAAAASVPVLVPDAAEGILARFAYDDTHGRIAELAHLLPPVALAEFPGGLVGEGTGAQQNARISIDPAWRWTREGETGRVIQELGIPGYLLFWLAKLGLAAALLRGALRLRRAGRGAMAGCAGAYAFYAMTGNWAFDHVWQAMLCLGAAVLVAELAWAESTR